LKNNPAEFHPDPIRNEKAFPLKALSTLATIVAKFGDCHRKRRLSPKTATVAEFDDNLSPNSATIVASVDRALAFLRRSHQQEQQDE